MANIVVKIDPVVINRRLRESLVPNLKSIDTVDKIIRIKNTYRPVSTREILSLNKYFIFKVCIKTSKATMVATVKSNKNDSTNDSASETINCLRKLRFVKTWCDDSNPPKIAFNPLLINNTESKKPVESKPLLLLLKISFIISAMAL